MSFGRKNCLVCFFTDRFTGLVMLLACGIVLASAWSIKMRSPWLDEAYTISMVLEEPALIVAHCRHDAHPPGYYLLVKSWLKPFRLVGMNPGYYHAKSLAIISYGILLTICWFNARRAAGEIAGTLACWALVLSPRMIELLAELRQYSIATPLMICSFFLILASWRLALEDGPGASRKVMLRMIAAAVMSAAGMWIHLLTTIVWGLTVLVTVLLFGRRSFAYSRPYVYWPMIIFMVLPLACFLPWLVFGMGTNYEYVMRVQQLWMTPPTVLNLAYVVVGWLPFGQLFLAAGRGLLWFSVIAVSAAILLPFTACGISILRRSTGRTCEPLDVACAGALGVALAFILVTWLLARLNIAQVFHGPRYASLVLGHLLCGIVLLACAAANRLDRRWLAGVFAAPLFLVFFSGLIWLARWQHIKEYELPPELKAELLPSPPEPVYVIPSEFIPFLQYGYRGYNLRPVEELRDHPPASNKATVLHAMTWSWVNIERDENMPKAMKLRRLSSNIKVTIHPDEENQKVEVLVLEGLDHDALQLIGQVAWGFLPRPNLARSVSMAAPEWQQAAEGWDDLQKTDWDQNVRRAITSPALARFDNPLEPGRYVLRFKGFQHPYPASPAKFSFRFAEEPAGFSAEAGEGYFDLSVPFELAVEHEKPHLAISREIWHPIDFIEGSQDMRPFAFSYYDLWVERD